MASEFLECLCRTAVRSVDNEVLCHLAAGKVGKRWASVMNMNIGTECGCVS